MPVKGWPAQSPLKFCWRKRPSKAQDMEAVPADTCGFSLGFNQERAVVVQLPSRGFKTACSAPGVPNSFILAIWACISSEGAAAFLSAAWAEATSKREAVIPANITFKVFDFIRILLLWVKIEIRRQKIPIRGGGINKN